MLALIALKRKPLQSSSRSMPTHLDHSPTTRRNLPARVREGEESISARIARALAHANQRMKDASGDAKAAAARLEAEARAEAAAQTAAALVQAQRRPPGKRVV